MSDIVSPLLQWLNAHPQLSGLVTFLISAGESVAIIGTIVPGTIMMTALGTLAGAGVIPLGPTIFWAIMGAIVGDGISYWIGHCFKEKIPQLWPFRYYPHLLESGENFLHKYGSMSVFIGRFVGPVRALVPLVAGMFGMKPLHFTIANVTSAIGWAPAYMLPGILLGAASLELPPDIAIHVILVFMLITLFIMLCLWFIYKIFQLIHAHTQQIKVSIWQYLQHSRHFPSIAQLLKHHHRDSPHGQLTLAFYFIICSLLFLCLAMYVNIHSANTIMVNDAVFHFFRGIRTPSADDVMLNLSLLAQKQVILPVVLILFAWLLVKTRWRAAFHVLGLGILAAGSVFVLKNILQSPRPWGIAYNGVVTFSMPSGHATLATTLYVGLAFLLATAIRPGYRWPLYTAAILLSVAIGISRFYLGAHWFTDVLSAWLLSAALLLVVIISYQRYAEKPLPSLSISLVCLAALIVTFSWYHHRHFAQFKRDYAVVEWPRTEFNLQPWWQKNHELPFYRASLFGFPSQRINIEWAGSLDSIRQTLVKEGWSKPPARDWVSTLHRIADIKSTLYLPLISPQYLDKRPELILTRQSNTEKSLLVLRLWDANRTIRETKAPLWVGIIGIVPRSYSWLFKAHPGDVDINPALVFPNKMGMGPWQWKILKIDEPTLSNNKTKPMNVMLIRANKSLHKKH